MSNVDVLCIDCITHIFVDNPAIDSETLALIKRNNLVLPDSHVRSGLVYTLQNQIQETSNPSRFLWNLPAALWV